MTRPALVALAALALPALAACEAEESRPSPTPADFVAAGGHAETGERIVRRLECGVCHVIPGVAGARGIVGPPLEGFARRTLLAGRFPNRPETVARFVRNPPALAPDTGMPALPMTEEEAIHITAFLATLR